MKGIPKKRSKSFPSLYNISKEILLLCLYNEMKIILDENNIMQIMKDNGN